MTTLIEMLTGRRQQRRASTGGTYWSLLQKGRSDLDALELAELETAIDALGKSTDDVAADCALLEQLAQLGDLDRRQAAADRAAAELMKKVIAGEAEAKRLRTRADELDREAQQQRAEATRRRSDVNTARGQRGAVVRQLSDRGFPAAQEELARRVANDELHDVRTKLAEADKRVASVEQALRDCDRKDAASSIETQLNRARREADALRARERELVQTIEAWGKR